MPAMARSPAPRDAVDAIIEQWHAVRPDIDVSTMGVIGRISRLARAFERGIGETFQSEGLAPGGFDVLATLRRTGEPYQLSPTDLFDHLMVSSGAMTNRLDRLQEAGLVRRRPDPRDRRALLIELTPKGIKLVDRLLTRHVENEERLLAAYSPAERATLARLLRKGLLALDGHERR